MRGRGNARTRISKDLHSQANTPLGHRLVHRVVSQDESAEFGSEVLDPTSSRERHVAVTNGIGQIAQAGAPSANTQFPFSESDRIFPT